MGITKVHRGITKVHSGAARCRRHGVMNPIHAAFIQGLGYTSNGRSLCNHFLDFYVIFIGSRIMHALSVFSMMSLFCASVTISRMPNDAKLNPFQNNAKSS